jgi:hypothetical protein
VRAIRGTKTRHSARLFLLTFFIFGYFCYFFIAGKFCNKLFTIEGGKVSCFNLFLDGGRGRGAPLFIYFDLFYCSGGGGEG